MEIYKSASRSKRSRLRPTLGRIAVLDVFKGAPSEHLTAEQVYRRLDHSAGGCSVASVYRAISWLLDTGAISSARIGEQKTVYELSRGRQHGHLVCQCCGFVEDIDDTFIRARCEDIALSHGFKFAAANFLIYGVCTRCYEKDFPSLDKYRM